MELRRRNTRPLKRWEVNFIGAQEKLDPILGMLDYAQGDTPIWFDGAGSAEVFDPVLVGIGDGNGKDFRLPHRHVFVSSLVIYQNASLFTAWAPVGSSVIADSISFTNAPALYTQITAKYRRRVKVVLETEGDVIQERAFRNIDDPAQSLYKLRHFLQEVAV